MPVRPAVYHLSIEATFRFIRLRTEWTWRLYAENGRLVGWAGQTYANRQHALTMARRLWVLSDEQYTALIATYVVDIERDELPFALND